MTNTTQPEATLLPCPFCGMPARLIHNDGMWWCECINERNCSAVQPVCNHADVAIRTWNRRAPNTTDQATIQRLRAELAALRAEPRWEPVESGEVYFDFYIGTTADRRVRIRKTDALGKITNDFVTLPDNWNVCRLVPGQACTEQSECDTPAQEGSE